ncbi:vWA domain-containing protein [Corynebacterium glutamicum]|uniref:vWA domain-containing protein n=1 Tax=Corynebacterium glutamicum TaxID=1718 RepID=UPI002163AB4A|nr:VWA domain-containing protein [Corynebacterium glutamicum]
MSQPLSKRLSIRKALASAFIVALAFSLSPVAKAQANETPTMIVLDNSGSMTAQDAGGQTRIDAAKQASTQLINDISDRTDVGLTYYGGNTGETEADVEMGCQDVTIVGGPSRGNAGTLIDTINSLQPRGFTPIGKALTDTAAELPEGGNIVLVSDGIANCTPPDVCEVAQELAQSGINLVINTIGLNVDPAAREELECIAGVGSGTYADASDAQSLTDALTRAASRQYNSYTSDVTKLMEHRNKAQP